MDPIMVIVMLMSGLIGGWVAWKYATWNLYRRPGAEWATDEIAPERINRRLLARRKRQRLQITTFSALLTPVLLYALLIGLDILIEVSHTR